MNARGTTSVALVPTSFLLLLVRHLLLLAWHLLLLAWHMNARSLLCYNSPYVLCSGRVFGSVATPCQDVALSFFGPLERVYLFLDLVTSASLVVTMIAIRI